MCLEAPRIVPLLSRLSSDVDEKSLALGRNETAHV